MCSIAQNYGTGSPTKHHDMLLTHRSDMWGAAVIILELYAGGLTGLQSGRGENAPALLESLARRNTIEASDAAQNALVGGGADGDNKKSTDGEKTGDTEGLGNDKGEKESIGGRMREDSGRSAGNNGKRKNFRVAMPEGVLTLLREMFRREEGARPVSMEVGGLSVVL